MKIRYSYFHTLNAVFFWMYGGDYIHTTGKVSPKDADISRELKLIKALIRARGCI